MNLNNILRDITIPLILILSISQFAQAQDYKSSVGGRLGTYVAASFSTYLSEGRSLEGIAGISREANQSYFIFGSFYKLHFDVAAKVPTLTWYSGLGFFLNIQDESGSKKLRLALSAIIGMEYTLEDTPVNFFLDLSPHYSINTNSDSKFNVHANLGARYVLNSYD